MSIKMKHDGRLKIRAKAESPQSRKTIRDRQRLSVVVTKK